MQGPVRDRFDRPLGVLRLSVTDRCNLRCSYCMPEADYRWLPRKDLLDFDEIETLGRVFANLGVKRARLTGGEPLLRRDLPTLLSQLARVAGLDELALTTNGVLLRDLAQPLMDAGLRKITVSLDTLSPSRFLELTRKDALADVLGGIDAARRAGLAVKLDTVVLRGTNDDELAPLLTYALDVGAELRFIEYMDVGGATRWHPRAVVSRQEILARVATAFGPLEPLGERGSAPAERFALSKGGTFGVIASVTEPFCRGCDRSRVTADGMWFPCLYATRGLDLKTPLRAGATELELGSILEAAWRRRDDRGAELRAGSPHREALIPLSALRGDPHLEMHTRGG